MALRNALEQRFLSWASDCGAHAAIHPALLRVDALDRLDYFHNFPHLAMVASPISTDVVGDYAAAGAGAGSIPSAHLQAAGYVLPSAACYGVYLGLDGRSLAEPLRVTTAANCFRCETQYDGLRRLLGFYMREIVCVGERDVVLEHLRSFRDRIQAFLAAIDLPVEIVTASDPFYDGSADRARVQQLFPVKEEFVYDGTLAIASVNFHRNFFGERCAITVADGTPAFSGCVAFGLERWISALTSHLGTNAAALCERIASAG